MSAYVFYLAGFGIAFGISLIATRSLRDRGSALGLVDVPRGERHLHAEPVPTVGGLAVALSVLASFLPVAALGSFGALGSVQTDASSGLGSLLLVLAGALAMLAVGTWDDAREISARVKFAAQVAVAAAVFGAGVRVGSLTVPGLGAVEFGLAVSFVLTVFWLVAITNAFNLLDGIDGLAGGAALLATLSMFVASLVFGQYMAALLLAVTAAAVLGFLHFNFPPASVFLGDAGSLFLGFLLAGVGLVTSTKAATAAAIAIPVVALGLPVLDTVLAMVRRFLRGERLTKADRRHIHYRLVEMGHSPRTVALILYGACGVFGLASLLMLSEDGRLLGLVFLVMGAAIWFALQRLHVPELMELGRVIDRGMRQRRVIAGNLAVREGAERIAGAASLTHAFRELGEALHGSPFEEAEVWLSREFLGSEAGAELFPEVAIADGGYLWRWRKVPLTETDPGRCWEVVLPVVREGEKVGRMTLRRRMGEDMPTEVEVVAGLLLPEMAGAVERLGKRSPDGTAAPETTVAC